MALRVRAKTVAFWLGATVGATELLFPKLSAGIAVIALALFVFWLIRILQPAGRTAAVSVALVFAGGFAFGLVTVFAAFFFYANWMCTHRHECL